MTFLADRTIRGVGKLLLIACLDYRERTKRGFANCGQEGSVASDGTVIISPMPERKDSAKMTSTPF